MPPISGHRPTWAEINLENLEFNFRSVKSFIGEDIEYMAVVKADAYGHGAVECSKRLEEAGIDWLAVAIPEEGIELRMAGIRAPILCLGGFSAGEEVAVLNHDLTPVVFRLDQAESLDHFAARQNSKAAVHVKVDTGMGRIGIRPEEVEAFAQALSPFENLELEGLMTHFAVADKLSENDFTNHQIKLFADAVEIFHAHGFRPKYLDMANSPGAVAHPLSRAKMVRIGGILYGLGGDVLPAEIEKPELKPVMALRSKIALIKQLQPGDTVGYGRIFTARRESLIATVPIGYHDGVSRSLSNKGRIIVNGQFAPIVGRISMDWTTIDVTDIHDPMVGDTVTFIGSDGEATIFVEDIASSLDTISYEITCGIDRRVRRIYT